ncbi:MAG: signal recognition particle subunit [Watsoniomyces obsoletus]|nr:MAG: signal recognition particle subunit [Watsoniomyces obsoletus]
MSQEISDTDSDPMDMDPSDFEPTNSKFPLQPRQAQASHPSTSSASASLLNPSNIPFSQSQLQQLQQQQEQQSSYATTKDLSPFKAYQCIYPVYFDARRSRSEGRRVGKELAVENPLARDIVDAVQLLGLKALFEPGKIHPKDWSNPGRVKVLVKVDGKAVRPGVVNNS